MNKPIENEFDQNSLADWQSLATKSLRGQSLADLAHVTACGIPIEPLYTQRPDASQCVPAADMQRWDNRLAVIGGNIKTQSSNILAGLQGGVDSLQITIDSPEQPTPVQSTDLATVLTNVQLDIIPISLYAGSQFSHAASNFAAECAKQGIAPDKVSASFNADPLGTLAATGNLAVELNSAMHDMTQLAIATNEAMPQVNSVCVNTVCYHNAGATNEQELVSSIATGAFYLQALLDAGLNEQAASDTMVFQTACDADAISNVVKLRALKQLWTHVTKQFGVLKPSFNLVVETSQRMQSNRAPWVNHLRNVSAATAAAMADTKSIIIHPHNRINDQFIDDQIELSARVARNIPIILSEESAMTFVHDPMAGSYAIETLTTDLTNASWQALQQLETDGGLIQALTSGHWQASIATSQAMRVERLQKEQDIQVGVNKYQGSSVSPIASKALKKAATKQLTTHIQPLDTVRDALEFEI